MNTKTYPENIIEKEEGYNLIEVMIAIVILAVGILGIAMMQVTAIDANSRANKTTLAVNNATSTLERLINENDGNIQSGVDPNNPNISWTVTAGPSATTKIITVTVENEGVGRPIEMTYIRSDGQYVD